VYEGSQKEQTKGKDHKEWKSLGKDRGAWRVAIHNIYGTPFRGLITKDFFSVMTDMQ
jgi:hypothetical protein